jgi:CubicO group peptidase (beta-lactamase class C family)
MVNRGRRSFVRGVGWAAAGSIATLSRRAGAKTMTTQVVAPSVIATPDIQPIIDRERDNIHAVMAKEDIPGVAVCLVHAGKPAWIEGFGVTDQKSHRRVGDRTIFSVQSTSKNFTAVAIMMAVQRGLLDLDEPITTYLPDFTVRSRFDAAPERKMTLRLLLSHRAGFTHEAPVGNNFEPAFPDFESHIASISRTWLRYPVGERYRYSNLGVDVAGYILQVASKMPFAECLRSQIFEPLGMSDSTVATDVYVRRADRAIGHAKGYTTVPSTTPLIPSGGVYTSARDIAAYLDFHLNRGTSRGKTLLEEKLWREMHSFSLGGNYSLGVGRAELRYGDTPVRMLNHNGGGFGFGSVCNYCPEAQFAWAAFFNQQGDAGYRLGTGLTEDLLTRQYGPHRPRLPAADLSPIEVRRAQMEELVGRYVGRTRSVEIKIENGKLGTQAGSTFTPLQFTSPTDVFVTGPTGDALTFRYFPARHDEAAHLECEIGDFSIDYSEGPHDAPGPDKSTWERFLGDYQIYTWGLPSQRVKIHRKNGYLYLDETRLFVELEPGLFFAGDGEAVDFRHAEPTWRNVRLQRIS